jgi:hypothetical protein
MKEKRAASWGIVLALTFISLLSPTAYAGGDQQVKDFFAITTRLRAGEDVKFDIPAGETLIITDIVVQNRAPGDEPIDPSQFSRVVFNAILVGSPGTPQSLILTAVGNDTLNLHFTTGLRTASSSGAETTREIFNVNNSSAPFFEILVSGFLTKGTK